MNIRKKKPKEGKRMVGCFFKAKGKDIKGGES